MEPQSWRLVRQYRHVCDHRNLYGRQQQHSQYFRRCTCRRHAGRQHNDSASFPRHGRCECADHVEGQRHRRQPDGESLLHRRLHEPGNSDRDQLESLPCKHRLPPPGATRSQRPMLAIKITRLARPAPSPSRSRRPILRLLRRQHPRP